MVAALHHLLGTNYWIKQSLVILEVSSLTIKRFVSPHTVHIKYKFPASSCDDE